MMQINNDYFEDIDEKNAKKIINSIIKDETIQPGSYRGRKSSEPENNSIINGDADA